MQLIIDGTSRPFTSIRVFREAHGLPASFGVACFQPKDYAGLGSIDSQEAGAALHELRLSLLAHVPERLRSADLPSAAAALTERFRTALTMINPVIGLRYEEVEFAVAGFADVTQAFAYALLHARLANTPAPAFESVYADWLHGSVRVSAGTLPYTEGERDWRIQVISHVYGRFGLIIHTDTGTHYVYDPALACPAEGFMAALLREVCGALALRLQG